MKDDTNSEESTNSEKKILTTKLKEDLSFLDGLERNRQHPLTFEIPEPGALECLIPGDLVQIGVVWAKDKGLPGERFWFRLENRTEDLFSGRITNSLVLTDDHGLKKGDLLTVEARQIIGVDFVDAEK